MHKLFVYGTLRPAVDGDCFLEGYELYNAGPYPYIKKSEDWAWTVVGNILEVSDEELEALDKYEGVAKGLYTRDKVVAIHRNGTREEVWAYVASDSWPTIIPSGDWLNR